MPSTTLFITNPCITWKSYSQVEESMWLIIINGKFHEQGHCRNYGLSHAICNVSQTEKIRGWLVLFVFFCSITVFIFHHWCGCFIAIWWLIRIFLLPPLCLCLPELSHSMFIKWDSHIFLHTASNNIKFHAESFTTTIFHGKINKSCHFLIRIYYTNLYLLGELTVSFEMI